MGSKSKYILILVVFIAILLVINFWPRPVNRGEEQLFISENQNQETSGEVTGIRPREIIFVGDIMLDRKVELLMKNNSFFYPFEKISTFLNRGRFVFGNLEGPILKNPKVFSLTSMTFSFDAKVIEPLFSANFRILSLANNHTLNTGREDFEETKQLLGGAGIEYVGEPLICSKDYLVKDDLIFLAFNKTFSECKDEGILGIIESIRKENTEKFIIVSMHWGEEYKTKSSVSQKNLAHKIIDSGADLIIGHHPHVVEEIEKYKNGIIFYSLGNFIFDQYFSKETQEGLVVGLEPGFQALNYRLYPVEIASSQPFLISGDEAKMFLENLAVKSSEELSADIKNGIIKIERKEDNVSESENKVCFVQNCFLVELAETAQEQERGLMYRKELEQNRGMLFIFSRDKKWSFWMKNTLIPLDIIWLDKDKKVVFIAKDVQPCMDVNCPTIKPDSEARYVLEINAGTAQKINLKIGDKLTF